MSTDARDASEIARHYGNMRFAMFTVFTAIVGGLILIPLDKERLPLVSTGRVHWLLGVAGIVMSFGFALGEGRVSYLVNFYQDKAPHFHTADFGKYNVWKWLTFIIMVSPYLFSIAFWALFLCDAVQTH